MRFQVFKFSKRGLRKKPNQGKTESGTEHQVETHNQVEQKIIPLLREGVPHKPSAAPPMFEPSSARCRAGEFARVARAGG
jgi:hypothetical protein